MKSLLILLAFAVAAARAQGPAEPVFLDYADSLRSATVDSQVVRYFLGHVKFHQGATVVTCEKAVHNLATNLVTLQGGVRIVQDTLTITAPRAVYDAGARRSTAEGGVRLTDRVVVLTAANGAYDLESRIATFHDRVTIVNDTANITADDLVYNRITGVSVATGNVSVVDTSSIITCAALTNDRVQERSWCAGNAAVAGRRDRSRLFGDTIFHDAKRGYTHVPRSPLLIHIDSTRHDSASGWTFDTTFVIARDMEAYRSGQETYLAHDSVRILRGDMQARGGELRFERSANVIGLGRHPVAWHHDTQLTGDSITVFLLDNHIDRLVANGAAFALSKPDSTRPLRFDQLAGGTLTARFARDSLRSIRVEHNALSVYFGFNEGRARGVNRASGDTIHIDMLRGAPGMVYTLGGGEGQYFPEKMVKKNELDYRLTGFDNREAERPKRSDVLVPR